MSCAPSASSSNVANTWRRNNSLGGVLGRVVELVAEGFPLQVHAGQEVRQPSDARLREHQREAGVPFERAAEHHRRQRLVELQRQHRRERGRLPLAEPVAEVRPGSVLDVEADRQAGVLARRPRAGPRPGRRCRSRTRRRSRRDARARRCARVRPRPLRVSGRAGTRARTAGQAPTALNSSIGPVVPRAEARVLQRGIGDREAERERSVDHRRLQVVAVHVVESQLRESRRGSRRRRCRRGRSR